MPHIKDMQCFSPTCDYPVTDRFFADVPGARLWVETEGTGPAIITVHGGPGGNHCYFHPGLSLLARNNRMIYYDLAGHDMSSIIGSRVCGVRADAEDLENLRRWLGIDKFVVFGHSYGGMVAFEYSLKYRKHLSAMILCSAPVLWTDEDRENLIKGSKKHQAFEKAWEGSRTESEKTFLYYKWYYQRDLDRETRKYNELCRRSYKTSKARELLSNYEMDPYRLDWLKIRGIDIPTLLLFGRHDRDVQPDKARAMLGSAGHIKFRIFGKSGHDPFADQPAMFGKEILNFLRGLR